MKVFVYRPSVRSSCLIGKLAMNLHAVNVTIPRGRRRQTYGYLPSRMTSLPYTTGTRLQLMTEAHVCDQLAHGRQLAVKHPGVSRTLESQVKTFQLHHHATPYS